MAGTITEDYGMSLRSSASEGMLSEQQRCFSGDSIAEWRSSEQVENGTTSTSPPYWDTDDDDDCGPKPADLYGRFTWKIENFSTINKRELRSNAFEVGGYKWYILIYPQGCDVCNHLSLFLCVANHDKLLPGWSHFAQFTIAVANKDAKKSKYSDTLHRFWKKEHDWGWKKFMELSKVYDGFIVADTLVIKAQVQVIREKIDRPFRCLDGQYRRELVRVYLSNVEQICKRFLDKKISEFNTFIEDKMSWSSFRAFWLGIDPDARRCMSRDKTDAILKVVVKHFFIEKEVTSTLVMDSLYSGLKAFEYQSKNTKGRDKLVDLEELPAPMVHVDKDLFILADDVIALIERFMTDSSSQLSLSSKDDKCSQIRTKDGSSGDDISKDSVERDDERRLMELGYRTIEIFVLVHIFSSRIEVSYQEDVALKRQEELIREEEAAGLAEMELKSKRGANDKEKRSKKKQAKQKRNIRKGKDRVKDEKYNQGQERQQQETLSEERISESCPFEQAELALEKIDTLDDGSDASDAGEDVAEVVQPELDDRYASPVTPVTDASETYLASEASGSGVQNGHIDKKRPTTLDDDVSLSSSTDSVPLLLANVPYKASILSNNNKSQSSPNRGRNQRSKEIHDRVGSSHVLPNPLSDTAGNGRSHDATGSKSFKRELEANLISSKSGIQSLEKLLVEKEDDVATTQKKPIPKQQVDTEKLQFSPLLHKKSTIIHQPQKKSSDLNTTITITSNSTTAVELASSNGPSTSSSAQSDKVPALAPRSPPSSSSSMVEAQKPITPAKISSHQANTTSRPYSAPIVPALRLNAPIVSTVQSGPLLSRSASAAGRLGNEPSPQAPAYIPQSYRNAIMGKPSSAQGAGFVDDATSSGQTVAYSQSPSMCTSSCTPTISSQVHPRNGQTSVRPELTFGCLNPEVVHSQHLWTEDAHHGSTCSSSSSSSSSQMFGSSHTVNMEKLNIDERSRKEQYPAEVSSGFTMYQVQGTTAEEFPHLDIINDLLDEEQQNVSRAVRDPYLTFNRQYTFPGNLSTNIGLVASELYYDEGYDGFGGYVASSNPLQGFRDERLQKPADLSTYASNSRFDGLMRNQWPCWNSDLSMLSVRDGDANGYFYHLQDYLARGGNRYMYRPC